MHNLAIRWLVFGFIGVFFGIRSARADTKLTLDAALGYTSNVNLAQTQPESDEMVKAGGVLRIPNDQGRTQLSVRYTDYFKRSENDLVAADFGNLWSSAATTSEPEKSYEVRLSLRDYVKGGLGTTDQSFSHYGIIGTKGWGLTPEVSTWKLASQVDVEQYTSGSRTDFDLSLNASFEPSTENSDDTFSLSGTPGFLLSTVGDFSRFYFILSGDYEHALGPNSYWGARAAVVPSFYLSRATTSSILSTRGKRGLTTATTVREKESTLSFSPGVWWSRNLSPDWEFRTEVSAYLQSSKSNTYSFTEIQGVASLRYRVF